MRHAMTMASGMAMARRWQVRLGQGWGNGKRIDMRSMMRAKAHDAMRYRDASSTMRWLGHGDG